MIPVALGYTAAVYKLFFETAEELKKEREEGLYVSATSGNDEFGIGVKSLPYRTLRQALLKSEDGAVIYVGSGTYVNDGELEIFDRHIIGDKDNKPTFTCAEEKENIFYLGWQGTSVENICFVQKPNQKLTGVYVNNANKSSSRVVIRNCEFTGLQTAINTFRASVAIDSNIVRNCVWGINIQSNVNTSSVIRGNYFSGIGDKDVIVVGPYNRAEITGNTFNIAYDWSNYSRDIPRVIVSNSNPFGGALYARRNWWFLYDGLTPQDLVSEDVNVSYPQESPAAEFQEFMVLEKGGDFNGDGNIDFSDFLLFAAHYGASRGEDKWNPRFDLDDKGRIDLGDFAIFASNFGARERAKMAGFLGMVQPDTRGDRSIIICPSPSNSEVHINFFLPKPEFVSLKVYNVLGQEVVELVNSSLTGHQTILWDGKNNQGRSVASGRYYIVLSLENLRLAKPVILLR